MPIFVWVAFVILICGLLALDLGVFSKDSKERSFKEAAGWTAICAVLAVAFSGVVYFLYSGGGPSEHVLTGDEAALQFITAWLIEQSLSLDNIFVMALIFRHFAIPKSYQHRVLFWGIVGALIMRGIFIALGVELINSFAWINYVFGALLLYAGVKLFFVDDNQEVKPENNFFVRVARKFYPMTDKMHGEHFFAVENGKRLMTPLFVALLVIESTDVIFAVDSIPAVFSVTKEPFIVFTSNVFAIICLRSMYFLLSGLLSLFKYLKISLAVLLVFIGFKMATSHFFHISTEISLGVIFGLLGAGVATSIYAAKHSKEGLTKE